MNLSENVVKSFELQDRLNKVVNPDWINANYPWYRAAWIEAAELMDHMNYKWWKNLGAEGDRDQILLELVDIYHFLVSDMIVHKVSPHAIVCTYDRLKHIVAKDKEQMFEEIEAFVTTCTDAKMILPIDYCRMVVLLGFKLEEILKWYLAKNSLNIFRQENGYKTGQYIKTWNGQEDNVVLAEYVQENPDLTFESVYEHLTQVYQTVKGN